MSQYGCGTISDSYQCRWDGLLPKRHGLLPVYSRADAGSRPQAWKGSTAHLRLCRVGLWNYRGQQGGEHTFKIRRERMGVPGISASSVTIQEAYDLHMTFHPGGNMLRENGG